MILNSLKKHLLEIYELLGSDKKRLPGVMACFLLASMLELLGISLVGVYLSIMIDADFGNSNILGWLQSIGFDYDKQTLMMILSLVLLGIFFIRALVSIGVQYIIVRFGQDQQIRIRSLLMNTFQKMPYEQYVRRNSSEYLDLIQRITGQYSNTILTGILKTFGDAIIAFMILGFLAWQNSLAIVLLLGLFGVTVFVFYRLFRNRIREHGEQVNLAAKGLLKNVQEGITGLKDIRILGKEDYFYKKVKYNSEWYANSQTTSMVISAIPRYILEFILVLFIVLFVIISFKLGYDVNSIVPTLGMFSVAAVRLLPAVNSATSTLIQMRYLRVGVSLIYKELKFSEKMGFKSASMESVVDIGAHDFQNLNLDSVSYCYPGSKKHALKEISLSIQSGESVGLIGPSGSGKTTLVDVFLGLLVPEKGTILLNGKPINDKLDSWRAQVAYLPQEIFIIDDSLRKNIALGCSDEEFSEQRLQEAIKKSSLKELVDSLPEGANTILGEKGLRLSGGQRQRIALARAFYYGREVLIMDEATSALDQETELEIVEEIKRLKGDKTLIVIAHRLSTVEHCDRIYKLEHGRIIDVGVPSKILGHLINN